MFEMIEMIRGSELYKHGPVPSLAPAQKVVVEKNC